jgi:hypothetical protein
MYKSRIAILLLTFMSFPALAQSGDREQTWDVGVSVFNLGSVNLDGQMGSSINTESEYGFGFWGNYNLTNRWALGFDISYVQPRYTATFVPDSALEPETVSTRMDLWTFQGKAVFNLLEGPLTPYIEGGFGWTNVDSNIIAGTPSTGCWWDPWWGYVCDTFYSTYGDTLTSFSGAVGVRWDFNNYYGMRFAYGVLDLDTSSGTEDGNFEMWKAEFTWRF